MLPCAITSRTKAELTGAESPQAMNAAYPCARLLAWRRNEPRPIELRCSASASDCIALFLRMGRAFAAP